MASGFWELTDGEHKQHYTNCMEKWQQGLQSWKKFKIERCYKTVFTTKLQLHLFGDASERAYGAVAYLRIGAKPAKINPVMSKGRVAPTKPQTVPRLELNAATRAVRLYGFIIKENDIPI
ncbi:uncharacterized protein LOC130613594 [Hydractinia symbiolongicarpus]|uniref:uncharacterized protein LOC130613594 n=1 Tax=Hydractinia symbiolongicarpus TaxID=13093 RepID=UPI00254F6902|nr:uncharacterized protein LOC130613594 [Hydractinia symbiolongicarpus]